MLVSPGLSVKTYLQKFKENINSIKKIINNKGNCLCTPLNKIITKLRANEKKIMPIISAKPATAWLKNPRVFNVNSSVKINN